MFIKRHPYPFNCFHGCNIAFRRQDALAVGMFDEQFDGRFGYEDIEFGGRLWQMGCFIAYLPNATVCHLENGSAPTSLRSDTTDQNRNLLYAHWPELKRFRGHVSAAVVGYANGDRRPEWHDLFMRSGEHALGLIE